MGSKAAPLPGAVTTIDENISPSGIAGCIRTEINVSTLELFRIAITAHGNHAPPQRLGLLVHKVRQAGVNVSWGDGVDTSKVTPFIRERASHVDTPSLGNVVRGLLLGEVGNVAGHRCCDDKGARVALFKVRTNCLGTVEGAVEIGLNDIHPFCHNAIQDSRVGGAACVGHKGIDLTELLDHFGDKLFHRGIVANVALVGFGLDFVSLRELFSILLATLGPRGVGDGDTVEEKMSAKVRKFCVR